MRDLRDLAEPLFRDPPLPTPTITSLQRKAAQRRARRHRRRWTAATGTATVLLLVTAATLMRERQDASQLDMSGPTTSAPMPPAGPPDFTVDLHPPLASPSKPILPDRLLAIDDDTVAVALANRCGPVHHVDIRADDAEVELRVLAVDTGFPVSCQKAHWVATFDLPLAIHGRTVVARSETTPDEVRAPAPAIGSNVVPDHTSSFSRGETGEVPEATSVELRWLSRIDADLRLELKGCWTRTEIWMYRLGDVVVPQARAAGLQPDCRPDLVMGSSGAVAPLFGQP